MWRIVEGSCFICGPVLWFDVKELVYKCHQFKIKLQLYSVTLLKGQGTNLGINISIRGSNFKRGTVGTLPDPLGPAKFSPPITKILPKLVPLAKVISLPLTKLNLQKLVPLSFVFREYKLLNSLLPI